MTQSDLSPSVRLLEAVLFASADPLTETALQAQLGDEADVQALLQTLKDQYAPRGIQLVETGGLWSFRTAPDLASQMKIVRQPRRKLPRAAAEVLAIIAYHQPITRAEIESIRGVETSKGTLDILLELGWVRPGKRRETPGRPLTWRTTSDFLSHFNLASLTELPGLDDLKASGLLDTRPVLESMPRGQADQDDPDASAVAMGEADDEAFAAWVEDDQPAVAASASAAG